MRVVLDTNILVSALISPAEIPPSSKFTRLTSTEQMDEFAKSDRDNINADEEKQFKEAERHMLRLTESSSRRWSRRAILWR